MNNQKLFDICMEGWRPYDHLYKKVLEEDILTYTFSPDVTQYTLSLRVLKNFNENSLKVLEKEFSGKDIYFHALSDYRDEVSALIQGTDYELHSSIGHNVWDKILPLSEREGLEVISGRIDSDIDLPGKHSPVSMLDWMQKARSKWHGKSLKPKKSFNIFELTN